MRKKVKARKARKGKAANWTAETGDRKPETGHQSEVVGSMSGADMMRERYNR